MQQKEISKSVLKRLPVYLSYLKAQTDGPANISATALATALNLGEVQVRKDLAMVSDGGRPKIGYNRIGLIEQFLGYDNTNDAVIVGAGGLGGALMGYTGFAEYGLNIVAAFDVNPDLVGKVKSGKRIYPLEDLPQFCVEHKILMGIITVPAEHAQAVCNMLIDSGILAIWNFAPVHLDVPVGMRTWPHPWPCFPSTSPSRSVRCKPAKFPLAKPPDIRYNETRPRSR